MHLRTVLLVFALWGWFDGQARAQVYRLTDLGTQGVVGINDSGVIALMDGYGNSYTWRNGSTAGIGSPTGSGTTVFAINREGQLAGTTAFTADPSLYHAFRWENFVFTDLGTLGGSWSTPLALNNLGHVAGYAFVADTLPFRGFVWKDGVMTDLGSLGPTMGSAAQGINDSGLIVGNRDVPPDGLPRATFWLDGNPTDMGTLDGGTLSYAVAVNNAGQAVGSSSLDGNSGNMGFFWENGSMSALGTIAIPPGLKVGWSSPSDLNDSGDVVGSAWWDADPLTHNLHGFLWRSGVMTDLNNITDTSGGWEIIRGVGINNHGNIVAYAARNASATAVLLERADIILQHPIEGDKLIGGEQDTIRWLSGLPPGSNVTLRYTVDDGETWSLIAFAIPAALKEYVWTVPDSLSTKARVLIASTDDSTLADTSGIFRMKPYVLTKFSTTGDYIAYTPLIDYWGFGNDSGAVWPWSWHSRFNYQGIDPYTNASYQIGGAATDAVFKNALSKDHPDWPAFVEAFRTYQCYRRISPPIYSPTAVTRWESRKGKWRGSCFGIAIATAWAYRERTSFLGSFQNFPEYLLPDEVHSDSNVIPVINSLFTHQFGITHSNYAENIGIHKTPNQTLAELKEMFASDDAPVRSLSIRNNGPGGGGHAILAYKLKRDQFEPKLYHVFVYDNSYPTQADAKIIVDTTAYGGEGGWSYSNWSGWGGPRKFYLRDPAYLYQNPPDLTQADPGVETSSFDLPDTIVQVGINPPAKIVIGDSIGNVTGYVDSLVRADIPGSASLELENGSMQPPYGYQLTVRPYSVTLSEFADTASHLYFFTGARTFSIGRTGAASTQTDRFAFDGNVSIVNPDSAAKTYDIVNIVAEFTQSREKAYMVSSLELRRDDSVRIANTGVDGLKIASFAPALSTYGLDVELYDYYGFRRFTHADIPLNGNSSHIIQPPWGSITPGTQLTILIDSGNDGTVDDSLIVSNQPTGVPGSEEGVPSGFALHQNYPNPFNPTTSIAYELAKAAHVRLTVSDVLGREVAVLVDERQDAGYRTVEWDGSGLPGGVYFYRLHAGSFTEVKKMLLVK